jgi:ferredoxin
VNDFYVISRLCRDCVDGACTDVCPVDCILQPTESAAPGLPNQLFINPDECICCAACVQECPWEAIVHVDDVPVEHVADIEVNALTSRDPERFRVARSRPKGEPVAPLQVEQNRAKWR